MDRTPEVPAQPADRRKFAASRVTNGTALFPAGVDGRSAEARRYRDLLAAYRDAMPAVESTAAQTALLRALATVTLTIELASAQAAQGRPLDPAELVSLVNAQTRLLDRLDIAPKPPEPPDPLAEHRRRMGWDR